MKTAFLLAALLGSGMIDAAPTDDVDVFTGTSNSRWMMFPGATLPFGLVKLSPDNQGNVWNGGYEYTIGSISGFSHLHAFSLSGLSLMPFVGQIAEKPFPGAADSPAGGMWTSGYRSRFRKQDEQGRPGYYRVFLMDSKVSTELTATLRCGMTRLTYPASEQSRLLVNFDFLTEEKTEILGVTVHKTTATEIEGSIRQKNGYAQEFTVHFVLQLNRPLASVDAWTRGKYTGSDVSYGTDFRRPITWQKNFQSFTGGSGTGLSLNFKTTAGEKIITRSGISLVSIEGARNNLESEMKPFGWDFDAVVKNATSVWNERLGAVDVSGGSADDRKMFYTCLYRCFTGKSVLNDLDGSYIDAVGEKRRLSPPADACYSSDALWGTQWTLSPLWTLIAPKVANSWVNFFLEYYRNHGWLPEAPVNGKYSPVMAAQHQQSLIVSSYQKGIRDFDTELAWKAIHHDLTTPGVPLGNGGFAGNRHLGSYMKHGYVTEEDGPASSTLEYAYDDWAAAQLGLALGKTIEAEALIKRSQNYRNTYDHKVGFMRRRHADGSWVEPFDPFAFGTEDGWNGSGFVEGTPWIYTWFVPHDLPGLINLLGNDRFNSMLEEGFQKGQVDLTNQPNLQAPFLFNHSGRPWLTQKFSHKVLRDYFEPTPYVGWRGEEDEGQLSAYFAMVSMGLFQMDGGCSPLSNYDLSGPIFDQIVIHLDPLYYKGGTFTIETRQRSEENIYIQSATLNGAPIIRSRLPHSAIANGGHLIYEMGPEPNPNWGN